MERILEEKSYETIGPGVGAEDVDAAAIVGVEELVDGRVTVLRDRREMRLLLKTHI